MTGRTGAEVERELTGAWQALRSAVDSLSDVELEQPGVAGHWSVKDLLGHIAFWGQQAAENLQLIAAGRAGEIRRPGNERITAEWNEREWRLRKDRPLSRIVEECLESFEGARKALRDFAPERLQVEVKGLTVLGLFAQDTYEHYREHLKDIRAWQHELEATET